MMPLHQSHLSTVSQEFPHQALNALSCASTDVNPIRRHRTTTDRTEPGGGSCSCSCRRRQLKRKLSSDFPGEMIFGEISLSCLGGVPAPSSLRAYGIIVAWFGILLCERASERIIIQCEQCVSFILSRGKVAKAAGASDAFTFIYSYVYGRLWGAVAGQELKALFARNEKCAICSTGKLVMDSRVHSRGNLFAKSFGSEIDHGTNGRKVNVC